MSQSSKKAAITCSFCGRRWHALCAKLKAQARALPVWHCRECLGRQPAAPEQPTIPSSEVPARGIAAGLAELRASTGVIGRIPKAARPVIADSLAKLIDEAICNHDSPAAWWNFLSFAFFGLRTPDPPKGGERRVTLATHIRRQVAQLDSSSIPLHSATKQRNVPTHHSSNPLHTDAPMHSHWRFLVLVFMLHVKQIMTYISFRTVCQACNELPPSHPYPKIEEFMVTQKNQEDGYCCFQKKCWPETARTFFAACHRRIQKKAFGGGQKALEGAKFQKCIPISENSSDFVSVLSIK